MKPPCIMVVGELLPSLRVRVAKEMVEERGLKPIEAARRMGITPAAVTQYLKGVRGRITFDGVFDHNKIKPFITGLVDQAMMNPMDPSQTLKKICDLCSAIRSEGLICEYCRKSSNISEDSVCDICLKPCP